MYFALKLYHLLPKGPLLPITTRGGGGAGEVSFPLTVFQAVLTVELVTFRAREDWSTQWRFFSRLRPNPNPAPYLINRQSNAPDSRDSPTCQSVP